MSLQKPFVEQADSVFESNNSVRARVHQYQSNMSQQNQDIKKKSEKRRRSEASDKIGNHQVKVNAQVDAENNQGPKRPKQNADQGKEDDLACDDYKTEEKCNSQMLSLSGKSEDKTTKRCVFIENKCQLNTSWVDDIVTRYDEQTTKMEGDKRTKLVKNSRAAVDKLTQDRATLIDSALKELQKRYNINILTKYRIGDEEHDISIREKLVFLYLMSHHKEDFSAFVAVQEQDTLRQIYDMFVHQLKTTINEMEEEDQKQRTKKQLHLEILKANYNLLKDKIEEKFPHLKKLDENRLDSSRLKVDDEKKDANTGVFNGDTPHITGEEFHTLQKDKGALREKINYLRGCIQKYHQWTHLWGYKKITQVVLVTGAVGALLFAGPASFIAPYAIKLLSFNMYFQSLERFVAMLELGLRMYDTYNDKGTSLNPFSLSANTPANFFRKSNIILSTAINFFVVLNYLRDVYSSILNGLFTYPETKQITEDVLNETNKHDMKRLSNKEKQDLISNIVKGHEKLLELNGVTQKEIIEATTSVFSTDIPEFQIKSGTKDIIKRALTSSKGSEIIHSAIIGDLLSNKNKAISLAPLHDLQIENYGFDLFGVPKFQDVVSKACKQIKNDTSFNKLNELQRTSLNTSLINLENTFNNCPINSLLLRSMNNVKSVSTFSSGNFDIENSLELSKQISQFDGQSICDSREMMKQEHFRTFKGYLTAHVIDATKKIIPDKLFNNPDEIWKLVLDIIMSAFDQMVSKNYSFSNLLGFSKKNHVSYFLKPLAITVSRFFIGQPDENVFAHIKELELNQKRILSLRDRNKKPLIKQLELIIQGYNEESRSVDASKMIRSVKSTGGFTNLSKQTDDVWIKKINEIKSNDEQSKILREIIQQKAKDLEYEEQQGIKEQRQENKPDEEHIASQLVSFYFDSMLEDIKDQLEKETPSAFKEFSNLIINIGLFYFIWCF